ncbi:hypothetical protein K469DRAFT_732786 [Zopfia rhizophila CBS 207.26]|uniref:MFS general substrate transporter n=1 Tax=Zopfia rhizophila CBS 207.26 TaxID=1314779 RepID=A0A6A6EH73_9PEZI|nr:hypothetical protein K469DRAFT_732786 [Zopfia rhizophila CBS 207.26]
MDVELGFNKGSRYFIALLVFFIMYFVFEISSNVVLRKVGAANWLSFPCFSWGVATLDWPLSTASSPTGFGSILAYSIMQLSGRAGYPAIFGRILTVDFPGKVPKSRMPFLTPHEDRQVAEFDELTWKKFPHAWARWELWFLQSTPLLLILLRFLCAFGREEIITSMFCLLTAPPAVAAVHWIIFQAVLGIIGLMIIAYTKQNGARYFGVSVGLAGSNSNIPTAFASGVQVAFGAIRGIYAGTTFVEKEAPVGAQFYVLISTVFMAW